jgi:hypothetical protein
MLDHSARRLALALAFATVVWTDQSRAQQAQPLTPFEDLFNQYQGGDYDVVHRTVNTATDLNLLNPPEVQKLRKWLGQWTGGPSRAKTAYLLDLAVTIEPLSQRAAISLISEGRLYLVTRHDPIGVAPDDDAFELAWHKTAIALLEQIPYPMAENVYLDTVQHRYTARSHGVLDPRFVFQGGVAMEQTCWNAPDKPYISLPSTAMTAGDVSHQAAPTANPSDVLSSSMPRVDTRKDCLVEATRRYIAAASAPAVAAEANTRAAWMEFQLGLYTGALATIDRAGQTDDDVVTYWNRLFRARILTALGRDADAMQAYRAAVEAAPTAQSPRVGMALLLFKLKKIDDARHTAAEIRQMPSGNVDPWWTYLGADGRFVTAWTADMRKLVR